MGSAHFSLSKGLISSPSANPSPYRPNPNPKPKEIPKQKVKLGKEKSLSITPPTHPGGQLDQVDSKIKKMG